MKNLLAALLVLLSANVALASSTVNPSVPAPNSSLSSAPIRANFAATYADINGIENMFAGTTAPVNPVRYQLWSDTTVSPAVVKMYDGTTWVAIGKLDSTTHAWKPQGTWNGAVVAPLYGGTGQDFSAANGLVTFTAGVASVGAAPPAFIPPPSATTLGGVKTVTCASHTWVSLLNTSGVFSCSQPAAADLTNGVTGSGAVALASGPTLTAPIFATIINSGTITLPTSTDTLVGRATTDTLTNKSISGSTNTFTNIGNSSLTNSSITIAGHAVSLGGTQALACADLSNGATGCSTATGTSGALLPLLNGTNTWSGVQSFANGDLALNGATSGALTLKAAAISATSAITFPAGTTDFSATGGTSQVVMQASAGGAFTVAQLAASNLSDGNSGTGALVHVTSPVLVTPTLGAALATSINGMGIGVCTSCTLSVGNSKIPTINNSVNYQGTDGSVITTQATGTVVNRDSTDTLTNKSISGATNTLSAIPISALSGGVDGTTFTPVLAFGGASVGVTYTTQYGEYRTSGKQTCFVIYIVTSSKGSSTGTLSITGLPAANTASGVFAPSFATTAGFASTGWPTPTVASGASAAIFRGYAAGVYSVLDNTSVSNVTDYALSGCYFTS